MTKTAAIATSFTGALFLGLALGACSPEVSQAFADDLYKWGVMVRYNGDALAGAGSCIFLHIWRNPESPTEGCTAMAEEDLLAILGWLEQGSGGGPDPDPRRGPLLVQGTRAYLKSLRAEGRLPYGIPPAP